MPKPKKPTLKGSAASAASGAAAAAKGSTSAASAAARGSGTGSTAASAGGSTGGGGGIVASVGNVNNNNDDIPPSAGYLITCDVPMKQFIQHLNELKPVDKRFIILPDLDATHVLVKHKAKDEILKKMEEFQDSNIFSAVERVGEDLGVS
jgi:TFIIH basal transcription factor complex TTD-A subunit